MAMEALFLYCTLKKSPYMKINLERGQYSTIGRLQALMLKEMQI
jgi:hypothetical protein